MEEAREIQILSEVSDYLNEYCAHGVVKIKNVAIFLKDRRNFVRPTEMLKKLDQIDPKTDEIRKCSDRLHLFEARILEFEIDQLTKEKNSLKNDDDDYLINVRDVNLQIEQKKEQLKEHLISISYAPPHSEAHHYNDRLWASGMLVNIPSVKAYLMGREFLREAAQDGKSELGKKDAASKKLQEIDTKPTRFQTELNNFVAELKAKGVSAELDKIGQLFDDKNKSRAVTRYFNQPFSPQDIIDLAESPDGANLGTMSEPINTRALQLANRAQALKVRVTDEALVDSARFHFKAYQDTTDQKQVAHHRAEMIKAGAAVVNTHLLGPEINAVVDLDQRIRGLNPKGRYERAMMVDPENTVQDTLNEIEKIFSPTREAKSESEADLGMFHALDDYIGLSYSLDDIFSFVKSKSVTVLSAKTLDRLYALDAEYCHVRLSQGLSPEKRKEYETRMMHAVSMVKDPSLFAPVPYLASLKTQLMQEAQFLATLSELERLQEFYDSVPLNEEVRERLTVLQQRIDGVHEQFPASFIKGRPEDAKRLEGLRAKNEEAMKQALQLEAKAMKQALQIASDPNRFILERLTKIGYDCREGMDVLEAQRLLSSRDMIDFIESDAYRQRQKPLSEETRKKLYALEALRCSVSWERSTTDAERATHYEGLLKAIEVIRSFSLPDDELKGLLDWRVFYTLSTSRKKAAVAWKYFSWALENRCWTFQPRNSSNIYPTLSEQKSFKGIRAYAEAYLHEVQANLPKSPKEYKKWVEYQKTYADARPYPSVFATGEYPEILKETARVLEARLLSLEIEGLRQSVEEGVQITPEISQEMGRKRYAIQTLLLGVKEAKHLSHDDALWAGKTLAEADPMTLSVYLKAKEYLQLAAQQESTQAEARKYLDMFAKKAESSSEPFYQKLRGLVSELKARKIDDMLTDAKRVQGCVDDPSAFSPVEIAAWAEHDAKQDIQPKSKARAQQLEHVIHARRSWLKFRGAEDVGASFGHCLEARREGTKVIADLSLLDPETTLQAYIIMKALALPDSFDSTYDMHKTDPVTHNVKFKESLLDKFDVEKFVVDVLDKLSTLKEPPAFSLQDIIRIVEITAQKQGTSLTQKTSDRLYVLQANMCFQQYDKAATGDQPRHLEAMVRAADLVQNRALLGRDILKMVDKPKPLAGSLDKHVSKSGEQQREKAAGDKKAEAKPSETPSTMFNQPKKPKENNQGGFLSRLFRTPSSQPPAPKLTVGKASLNKVDGDAVNTPGAYEDGGENSSATPASPTKGGGGKED